MGTAARRRSLLLAGVFVMAAAAPGLAAAPTPTRPPQLPRDQASGVGSSTAHGAPAPHIPAGRSAWAARLTCPRGYLGYRVGAAATNITPVRWPVAEAAYAVGRMAVGAAAPFYARSLAIQACPTGRVVVLTALDSQGYFIAYRYDPGPGSAGYGTRGIRLTVSGATGIPAVDMLITSTHTHNSPDSIGIWGGSVTANNQAPYLSLVKRESVASIEEALASLQPARLFLGSANDSSLLHNIAQVNNDPAQYPTDHFLNTVQAVTLNGCHPIATLVRIGIHNNVAGPIAGPHGQVIDPDFFGGVARILSAQLPGDVPVVVPGAIGGIGWRFPAGTNPGSANQLVEVAAYSAVMARRVDTAIARSAPVPLGPVGAVLTRIPEEVANPLVGLFYDAAGLPFLHGLMRSIQPAYLLGDVAIAAVQTMRVGPLLFATSPSEAFPSLQTEVASHVPTADVLSVSLAGDQLGYTPPAYEYPVVDEVYGGAAFGQDNGTFTLNGHFGDDVIRTNLRAAARLGFAANQLYTGLTEGPVVPPASAGATVPAQPQPPEVPLHLPCRPIVSPGALSAHPLGPPRGPLAGAPLPGGSLVVKSRQLAVTGLDLTSVCLPGLTFLGLAAALGLARQRRQRPAHPGASPPPRVQSG